MRSLPVAAALLLLLSSACSPLPKPILPADGSVPAPSSTPSLALTATSTPTVKPSPTSVAVLATNVPSPLLCSPLRDITLDGLPGMVSNPYHPPAPGSDDPHHGVDLAVLFPDSRMAVEGHAVQAALGGRVASVIDDRFPYGNAVIIETPLEDAPAAWWLPAQIPTAAPTLEYRTALTCPGTGPSAAVNPARRSLYVLYAHLLQPAALSIGDKMACGQVFGSVGSSGNALSPHLHFEVRVGPSGMTFSSMAHYDNSATSEEMNLYCLWRISGTFQLMDPLNLLRVSSFP